MNIYSIPIYLSINNEVFLAYLGRADILLMFMQAAFFWLLPEALKKGVDKHRFFQIEISQLYLLGVIPIRFSWVTHTLFQTSFVCCFEAPATDVYEPGKKVTIMGWLNL